MGAPRGRGRPKPRRVPPSRTDGCICSGHRVVQQQQQQQRRPACAWMAGPEGRLRVRTRTHAAGRGDGGVRKRSGCGVCMWLGVFCRRQSVPRRDRSRQHARVRVEGGGASPSFHSFALPTLRGASMSCALTRSHFSSSPFRYLLSPFRFSGLACCARASPSPSLHLDGRIGALLSFFLHLTSLLVGFVTILNTSNATLSGCCFLCALTGRRRITASTIALDSRAKHLRRDPWRPTKAFLTVKTISETYRVAWVGTAKWSCLQQY